MKKVTENTTATQEKDLKPKLIVARLGHSALMQ